MITCLIFDLDGTLCDSMKANIKAYSLAFREVGLNFDVARYKKLFGQRFPEMMNSLAPEASEKTRMRIKTLKAEFYRDNLGLVKLNSNLYELIKSTPGKYQTALVTTASKLNVKNLLRHFKIRATLFDVIIVGEEVSNGKPDPECYLKAIKALGVEASSCLVFEDSEVGIEAAKRAGANVIRVAV